MKLIMIVNLLFNLNFNIIKNFKENTYKYQEMKEIRYIYFYDLTNFDINNIEIYIADRKLEYTYELLSYYKIDLNNYYPLSSLNIKNNNNYELSVKVSDCDNYDSDSFAYINSITDTDININNFIIDKPKWNIMYSNKKMKESKTIKLLDDI